MSSKPPFTRSTPKGPNTSEPGVITIPEVTVTGQAGPLDDDPPIEHDPIGQTLATAVLTGPMALGQAATEVAGDGLAAIGSAIVGAAVEHGRVEVGALATETAAEKINEFETPVENEGDLKSEGEDKTPGFTSAGDQIPAPEVDDKPPGLGPLGNGTPRDDGDSKPPGLGPLGNGTPGEPGGAAQTSGGEGEGEGESGCFVGDIAVAMADGSCLPISMLAIGSCVKSRDEFTGDALTGEVTAVHVHDVSETFSLQLVGGEHVETTAVHRFATASGEFLSAKRLSPATMLATLSGTALRIAGSTRGTCPKTVYNITVKPGHTFFVGQAGLWVHNVKDVHDPDGE